MPIRTVASEVAKPFVSLNISVAPTHKFLETKNIWKDVS